MLQMGNKLIMEDSIVERLKKIFQSEYSEVESKIISETKIGDQATEEVRFIFFIRCSLLDLCRKFWIVICLNDLILSNVCHQFSEHFAMLFLMSNTCG